MGLTSMLRSLALRYPGAGASVLRTYLRRFEHVPERFEWLVQGLKRDLPLPWEQQVIPLGDGNQLAIDSRSVVGREIFYTGSYEREVVRTLGRELQPGMIFIDAGANIGEFTVRGSRLVGPGGQVHAFEASPQTFADLAANVERNQLRNVTANAVALGSTTGTVEFFMSRGIASGSSSMRPAHDFSGTTVQVPLVSLDQYAEDHHLPRVDVIKMDIEGAELEAFRGATRLLARDDAPVIIFEYHGIVARRFGVGKEQLLSFLEQFGYRISRLGSSAGAPQQAADDVPENLLALPRRRR
jgi:FkbM family methyltransferase